jgi:hypothetical protein
MVASAFDGRVRRSYSIIENLPKIDWRASAAKKMFWDNSTQSGSQRPERPQR